MMKWIIIPLLILGLNGTCHEEVYYSNKSEKTFYQLLDTNFSSYERPIINSQNIVVHLNAFGSFSNPSGVSSYDLSGQSTLKKENTSLSDPLFFSIDFNEVIHIEQITLNMNAYREKEVLKKKIYINHSVYWVDGSATFGGGDLIYEGYDEGLMTLNLDQKCSNIYIIFEDLRPQDTIMLTKFSIDRYRLSKHQNWTKDKIEGAETYIVKSCIDSGQFAPNGNQVFAYDALSNYSPSATVISDYKPTKNEEYANYDYGKGTSVLPYSLPDIVKTMDQYGRFINSWTIEGLANHPKMRYKSVGPYGIGFPWIMMDQNRGVQYTANPVYWTQIPGLSNLVHVSVDPNWCAHVTSSTKTPCYKYQGHISEGRNNSYDITITTFENVVAPDKQVVEKADYYLVDTINNTESYIKSSDFNETIFHLNTSGIFKIKAYLTDIVGNTAEIQSEKFYIDQIPPIINYSAPKKPWMNTVQNVEITIEDEWSGIKNYQVQINSQGYFTGSTHIELDEEGLYNLETIATDFVGNQSIKKSETYKLDFTAPKISYDAMINEEDLRITMSVEDDLSGIDYWVYHIITEKTTRTSERLYTTTNTLELLLDQPIKIRIEAYDHAGNKSELITDEYKAYEAKLSDISMFSFSYSPNEKKVLYLSLRGTKTQDKVIALYQEEQLIYEETKTLNKTNSNLSIEYFPLAEETNLRLVVSNLDQTIEDQLILSVNQKTQAYQENPKEVNFNEIVASEIHKGTEQVNYYETLIVTLNELSDTYFQGQGLPISANISYFNQCARFDLEQCHSIDVLKDINASLLITSVDENIADYYQKKDGYEAFLELINHQLLPPMTYVAKHSGAIFVEIPTIPWISGGHKWYINKEIELGTYPYTIKGQHVGFNQISFKLVSEYNINETIKDQYKIRFVDPFKPNLNAASLERYESWFNELKE